MRREKHIEAVIVSVLNEMSNSMKEGEVPPSIEDVKAEVHNKVAFELELAGLNDYVECAIAKAREEECDNDLSDYILEELENAECSCTAM